MAENVLVARVEIEKDKEEGEGGKTTFLVRSPAVGVAAALPRQGIFLNPMVGFLTLRILNRNHTVLMPRNVQGWVAERFVEGTHQPVEFNQPLLRLKVGLETLEAEREGAASEAAGGMRQDTVVVQAPSEGIFYRRPSPDSAAYVEVGSPVTQGAVLGLVEVMKSFNQIVYGGPGLPERGTVTRIEAEDTSEVKFGQPLFLIQPQG